MRGGSGEELRIRIRSCRSCILSMVSGRVKFPAKGFLGGGSGSKGRVFFNGKLISPLKQISLRKGDEIVLRLPGGRLRIQVKQYESVQNDLLSLTALQDLEGETERRFEESMSTWNNVAEKKE